MELVQELDDCEIVLVEPVSMDMTLEAQSVSGSAVLKSLMNVHSSSTLSATGWVAVQSASLNST